MKHTPGPWTVVDQVAVDGSCTTLVKGGDHVVCKSSARPKARQKQDADAALIAAAPDLLAALQTMVRGMDFQHSWALDNARAAIAKATGGAT